MHDGYILKNPTDTEKTEKGNGERKKEIRKNKKVCDYDYLHISSQNILLSVTAYLFKSQVH